jgi:hypothetical protein
LTTCWADAVGVATNPAITPITHSDDIRRRVIGTLLRFIT